MYSIAFFGILMILFSAVMMFNPDYWSNGIVSIVFGMFIAYSALVDQ